MNADEYNGPEYGRSLTGTGVLRISRSALENPKKNSMKIGTWNVRSMYEEGKIENTIQEMKRLKLSILGISEMRWSGTGKCEINDHVIYYSGNDDPRHQNGVAIILDKVTSRSVKNFVPFSDRIILIQIETKPVMTNIIQLYAPTCNAEEDEIESFYENLRNVRKQLKNNDIIILMGDLNAKIGKGKQEHIVGDHGLGQRNERGDMFFNYCLEFDQIIMNTFFKLPPRRLYTWRAPGDTPENIIRNQIDYITINKRYRNAIKSVKTFPGADVNSDHNLLMAEMVIKLKKTQRKEIHQMKLDHEKIKNKDLINKVKEELKTKLKRIEEMNLRPNNDGSVREEDKINEVWKEINKNINEATKASFSEDRSRMKKQKWMTEDILILMEKRRANRQNPIEYKNIQREIRTKIRQAKTEWHAQQCLEIEGYGLIHDSFNQHKKIKEITGRKKARTSGILLNENQELILSINDRLKHWEDYIQELFDDERPKSNGLQNYTSGSDITLDEIEKAIQKSKNRKAPGPDSMHVEVLKILDTETLKILLKQFNDIYSSGHIPEEWLKSIFIPIPKSTYAKRCNQYRTISLMSHALKIFLKIIHQRICRKIEEQFGNTQFGFRGGLGTREALFCVQVLVQRCLDMNKNVYGCFIDFEKAFDRVQHGKLIEILKKTNIDERDIRIIGNLYWKQKSTVKTENEETGEVFIRRGVRQGCILSPLLFNLYSEEIFKEALEDTEEGINIHGTVINNIRYADDTVIFGSSMMELQSLMNKIVNSCRKYGLNLNIKKTKYMIISKSKDTLPTNEELIINGEPLERVSKIKYLGSNLNEDWEPSRDIKCRIEQARTTFSKMHALFKSHNLSMDLKVRMVRCYIFPVLLYGMESWTLNQTLMKKIESFEMWIYRRMLRISWKDKVRNTEVMAKMKKEVELQHLIKKRKLEYFGHIMRNSEKYGLLQVILQGRIVGRRSRGRRRTSWLGNLREWYECSSVELFRAAGDREKISNMIVNVRQRTRH
ncbi:hypothetical protein M8J77_015079 [Diaphorina citri]|nr:hypothetical protein M8J77_015079 [Diaphorina citri]